MTKTLIEKFMPRTKEQNELIKRQRDSQILNSALYLFSMKGFDGVTLDELSIASNCSHGLIYHYYSDKKELYNAVIKKVIKPMIDNLVLHFDYSQSAKQVMIDILDSYLKALKSPNDEYAWAINLILNVRLESEYKFMSAVKETSERIYQFMFNTIERGKTEGDFNKNRDSREQVISIVSIMKGLSYTRMRVGYRKFICPDVDILMGMLY